MNVSRPGPTPMMPCGLGTINTCRVTGKRSIYVGGSEPWRKCDESGWIVNAGILMPDFGACIKVFVRKRDGETDERYVDSIMDACNHPGSTWRWAEQNEDGRIFHSATDKLAWRPSPAAYTEPLTRENAKFAPDIHGWIPVGGMVPVGVMRIDIKGECKQALDSNLDDWNHDSSKWHPLWTHWRPASAPKAEEPKPRNVGMGEIFAMMLHEAVIRPNQAMLDRDERPESERERACRVNAMKVPSAPIPTQEECRQAYNLKFPPAGLMVVAPIWSPR